MRFDIDDVIPWIIAIFFVFLIALLSICAYCEYKESEEIEECFIQEFKTKECEYKLWRYENRGKTHTVSTPIYTPYVPVFRPVYH